MPTPIIVLAGQSNAARAGTRIGVGETAAASGALYVPFAVSGTPLSEEIDHGQGDWSGSGQPGAGEHLQTLFTILDMYLDPASPDYIPDAYLAGVVWIQGEADGFYTSSVDDYVGNLVELRTAVVDRYGDHEWVISALSELAWDTRVGPTRVYDSYMQLRANQLGLSALDGFTVVDPDQVATASGVASVDMFDPDRVHYTERFGITLGQALGAQLDVTPGDVQLQIGTSGADYFNVAGNVRHQLYGSTGLNSADFSAIDHGIVVTDVGNRFASVHDAGRATGFSAALVEIGRVYGTAQNDTFHLNSYLRDIRAGGGNDTVYAGSISINVQMGDGDDRVYGSAFNDNIIGQNDRDVLEGRDGDDRLFGGNGHDRLYGGSGNDLIDGSEGHDQLFGGAGDDAMAGGTGNDSYVVDSAGDTIVERGNQGTDRVDSSISFALGDNLEWLTLVDGAGNLNATGNALANRVYGNDGTNMVWGLGGDDMLYGGGGGDHLFGGLGNDRLYGGTGTDVLDGGLGNDTYYIDDTSDLIVEDAGGGWDSVESAVDYTLSDNIERLRVGREGGAVDGTGNESANEVFGGNGDNRLWGRGGHDNLQGNGGDDMLNGGTGDDRLYGGADADVLFGEVGNDRIYGGSGADVIHGGGGDDRLYGGTGDDTFYAGSGVDRINGGAGADMFIFGAASGIQTIEDFDQGVDRITMSGVTFDDMEVSSRGRGVQVAFSADHVIYLADTGTITMTANDFVFV